MDYLMDIKQIMEIIPHRQPFLLVDRILDMVPGAVFCGSFSGRTGYARSADR